MKYGICIFNLNGHKDYISQVAISPTQCKIISTSADNMIKIWNMNDGKLLKTIVPESLATCFSLFDNENCFICGCWDHTIQSYLLNSDVD